MPKCSDKCSVHSIGNFHHPYDTTFLINPRCSSSTTLLGWWLKLDHIGSEFNVIALGITVLFGLLHLSLLLGQLFQLFFVHGISLHLSLVLLLVLLDELLFGLLLFTHVEHLEFHCLGIDNLRAFHEDCEVVTSKGMHLLIKVGITQSLNQLNDNSRWLQSKKLLLDGLVCLLQDPELLVSWILENIRNKLVENIQTSNYFLIIIVCQNAC